ncbi:MAG: 50S ribosomal protein L13 [bacterium]|nr:50S ribosomal protein L13 [bacterium]
MKDGLRTTHEIDAAGLAIGRLATRVVLLLRGKDKPTFVPRLDEGAIVVIKNVDKLSIRKSKLTGKMYSSHSQYPGGLKRTSLGELIEKKGHAEAVRRAVLRMLPNNTLRKSQMKRISFV